MKVISKIPTELGLIIATTFSLGSVLLAQSITGLVFGLCCFVFSACHLSMFYIKRKKR